MMSDAKTPRGIPRVQLPKDVRLDTLAVREGLPPSAWGENSEALFLTSSFVQPDAATAAARFANEEEAFIYSRFTNPTVTMFERRLAAMKRVVGALNPALAGFEASCFDGVYITGDVSAADFDAMAAQRSAQGDEEESEDRSRLALQSATETS